MPKLNELTLIEALDGLKSKKFSSRELLADCFTQIEKLDPQLRVFITIVKDEALKKADEADVLISKDGENAFVAKPLLGIPYVGKDNFSTKGIQTTASSKVLEGYIPPFESTVTKRLNDAGAILIGKANMDAFAHGSSTETSDFFTTLNPWDITKVPGGSSGGSAAAVAAHMCTFAVGSETGGSIRGPASWCGVTGLKPSYGRVSRYGIVAMASSTDCPGPVTKTALDSAFILKIIAGKDPLDATTTAEPVSNYFDEALKFSLKGVKIGRPASYFEIDLEDGVKEKVDKAIDVFKELGAEIVDVDMLSPKYAISVYTILQRSEVSSNLARLDGIRYGNDRTAFGFEAKKRIMLGTYTLSSGYYDAYYAKAQKVRTLIINSFNEAFEKCDLLIAPSMPCVALDVGESSNSPMFGELMDVLNEPSCISGNPGVTVPCGFYKGLPVGVQIMGKMNEESAILGAVARYQEATDFNLERPKII